MTSNGNNFWNTCERELNHYPDTPCQLGACAWKINSKEYNNCFWTYIKLNSRADGTMKELTTAEISKLLNIPSNEINAYIEEADMAMRKLVSSLNSPDSIDEDTGPLIMPKEELEDQDAFDIIIEDNPLF